VFVDGKKVGEIRFPGGGVDLTAVCSTGGTHVVSLYVLALPLKGVLLSYGDTNAAREVTGAVERKGLCGDVWLVSEPAGPRIADVTVDTSIRKRELTVGVTLEALAAGATYSIRAEVRDGTALVRRFTSPAVAVGSQVTVTEKWLPDKLWDLHTPHHQFDLDLALLGPRGQVLDAGHPVRFGFREFWIDGRDFYLNGTRIHLSAVPLDNAEIGARTAGYDVTRETLKRLKSFGINFVYTHNYGCEPGTHLSFTEVLRAADDEGVLVALSQPHFGQYDWKATDADTANGYARHATFYVRVARNHPSVVAYAMSHNATGYAEDMNPDLMDGLKDPRAGDNWSRNNAALARRAEAIVRSLDPGRMVYHHSSGNLGSMHTVNFYTNFVPIQEMSDWFEHWATAGVKPLFLCEYGVPFTWD
jgi:beta-galactosidase/beta-glucuronidase